MKHLLDLELLKTFLMVVEEGGFKDAASRLYRSQAAVSMQIKRLEEQLGICLLQRNNQGIRLTDEGRTLLSYSQRLLGLNYETLSALRQRSLRGPLRIGVPTDYAETLLLHFIPLLKQNFPEIAPQVNCGRSRELRKLIQDGQLDIAVVTGEPAFMNEETLWSERMIWAASPSLNIDQDKTLPLALFDGDCILQEYCLRDLKESGRHFTTVLTSPELKNLRDAVISGLAVSLLPESSLHDIHQSTLSVPGLPQDNLLSINLIHAEDIDSEFLMPLAECFRQAAANAPR